MPVKPITVRFFRLQLADDDDNYTNLQLSQALAALSKRENYNNYTYERIDYILDQDDLRTDAEGFLIGVMVNNQMTGLTRYDSDQKGVTPFSPQEMTASQGSGNDVCFLIDPATNILAVESREKRTRYTKIVRWIEANLVGFDSTIYARPALRPGAMQVFNSMQHGVKARFKFARINPAAVAQNVNDPSVGQVIGLATHLEGHQMDVVVSTSTNGVKGANRPSLNMPNLRTIAHRFIARNAEEDFTEAIDIESIYIEGFNAVGESVKIDLITNKLIETVRVDVSESRIVTAFNANNHIFAMADLYRSLRPTLIPVYAVN